MSDEQTEKKPAKAAPKHIEVRRDYKPFDGVYVVRQGRNVRLMPVSGWTSKARVQVVEEAGFNKLPKPHDFARLLPINGEAGEAVNNAMWTQGIFKPDQVRQVDIDRAVRQVGALIAEALKAQGD